MSGAPAERASFEQLVWITACVGASLLAHVATVPWWVIAAAAAAGGLRLALAARGRSAPPAVIRLTVSAAAIGLLFLQLRTFNGLNAGTALLCLIAGLKLLETQTHRDIRVVTLIVYFLSLAALLQAESFWLLGYLIVVCWLTTAGLLGLGATAAPPWRRGVRHTGRILAQATPLALAFWLFFPRFGGPLWHLPDEGGATSGLGDSMSPGDITELALSDDVAFRVRFSGDTPPPAARYWRGPVLHEFDGHTWRRGEPGTGSAPPLSYQGPVYRYTLNLEPNQRTWIFVLDWPSGSDAPRSQLTSDYMIVQSDPLMQPEDVAATSYAHVRPLTALRADMRTRDTRLMPGTNPRTQQLAARLHEAHRDEMDYVHAVLEMFRDQPFFYTLTPPRLAADSVDAFLFDTRQGFCGHYASAFATLMRAAGIPARVVTGYQGGTYNRFAGYWIVRQSDAHAWDEIWLDGAGWLRIDPTSMIAPERVSHGLNDLVTPGEAVQSRWQQHGPWFADVRLRLDALRLLWRERILRFDQNSQDRILGALHIPQPDGQKLAIVLALCLIGGMSWLTWQVRRELGPRPQDPAERAYRRLCGRLARLGLPRRPHEGPEAFARRVALERPDLASAVGALCRRYSDLRYAAAPTPGATALPEFIAAVRAFRPRGSRGSS